MRRAFSLVRSGTSRSRNMVGNGRKEEYPSRYYLYSFASPAALPVPYKRNMSTTGTTVTTGVFVSQPSRLCRARTTNRLGDYNDGMNPEFDPPFADLFHRLGDIPADRVRLKPTPGTAKIEDLLLMENKYCELIDHTLVQKAVGFREAVFNGFITQALFQYAYPRMGFVTGATGCVELVGGSVRAPDASFFSWDRACRRLPDEPIPFLTPDLAVEVLKTGNTPQEMSRKYTEFFRSGVRLVWEFDIRKRLVQISGTSANTPPGTDG